MDQGPEQRVETFPAKRLLTPVRYGEAFFPAEYTMNLYRGCNHGCLYCDTRGDCYRIDRFDQVRHKETAWSCWAGAAKQRSRDGAFGGRQRRLQRSGGEAGADPAGAAA